MLYREASDNQSMKNSKKKLNKLLKKMEKAKSAVKLTRKTVIYLISGFCAVVLITGICIGVHVYQKRKADRTVRVAFYGLSEEMCTLLKEKIPQEENIILEFDVISDGAFDTAVVKQKYDMLFTWRGEITDTLSASAEDIPQKILESIPTSLRNKKCVPILLDHCELTFSKEVIKKINKEIPMSYTGFNTFLESAKGVVFSPFFCNGAEDRIMIDFLGAIVMAKGGLNAYNTFIEELRKASALDDVLDVTLDKKRLTLRSILDELKTWPQAGYTHPSWFNGRGNDLFFFAEDKQLACFFTLLSEHRKIPYNVIKDFDASLFPPEVSASNYGLIAPAVSVMLISDNTNCKRYIGNYFTEEAQDELSNKTMLAPVHYRAQAYDRQADDVRFWAASCAGGAVPDLYLAVYQRKSKELSKICTEIRNYVR